MKMYKKILSTFLAVIFMLGSLTSLMVVDVSAASTTTAETIHAQYVKTQYKTPEEKLNSMTRMLTRGDYELYVDRVSGEVAMRNVKTEDILFSNPYDVASSKGSSDSSTGTKNELLSQILIKYTAGGATTVMTSFKDAAMRDQISIQNTKNGIRVEYTIGQDESRKLVPRQLSKTNYDELILAPMQEAVENKKLGSFQYEKFKRMYTVKTLEGLSEIGQEMLLEKYPWCGTPGNELMVLKDASSVTNMNWIESLIKGYCEEYTFEQMDADHEETGYVAKDEKYPLFRLALEYELDDTGLLVSVPCNSLRYDMASYTLENFSVLPYMGAGNYINEGYNFFPDGSGSLFNFKQLNPDDTSYVSGKVYGVDYAYHVISGTYERVIRYPVYGSVAEEKIYSLTFTTNYKLDANNDLVLDSQTKEPQTADTPVTVSFDVSNTVMSAEAIREYVAERQVKDLKAGEEPVYELSEKTYKRGYVAVIESGESLAEIETYQGGKTHNYNTLRNYFNPKPKDTYTLKDALSVTGSTSFPVVSERRYTGDVNIRYQMLTDPAKEIRVEGESTTVADSGMKYYETTWLGMAEAYRDNLVESGKLSKLTEDELENDIPLYLETFGALETKQTIATIPVDVMTPLTTFDNVYEMYTELSTAGVNNINFKLTGYANGGMYATVPSDVKWEKAVGGASGLRELLKKAEEVNATEDKHLGLYPDFDFAYIHRDTMWDDTKLKDDALKTIDGRYSSKRQYSATQQSYVTFYQLAMSPSRYSKFYEKVVESLSEYGLKTISIGSLGNALNSDFDEEDPYNREDSKDFTARAFQDLKAEGYSLMTESANAYTWAYVDHIINVDLDSSRYVRASASVPFIGAVLHGYVQFAGAAFNEEGDTDYAMLRAIENGAGLYFILSYQNTQELKKDEQLSQYYSIRYDIWKNDVISYYKKLNALLSDVQDKVIIKHEFLEGERVLDADELEEALKDQLQQEAQKEHDKQNELETQNTLYLANRWKTLATASASMSDILARIETLNASIEKNEKNLRELIGNEDTATGVFKTLDIIQRILAGETVVNESLEEPAPYTIDECIVSANAQLSSIKISTVAILKNCYEVAALAEEAEELWAEIEEAADFISGLQNDGSTTLSAEALATMQGSVAGYKAAAKQILDTILDADTALRYTDADYMTAVMEPTLALKPIADAMVDSVRANAAYADEAVADACQKMKDFLKNLTEESILESAKPMVGNSGSTEEGDVAETVLNNNQIVLVTYGTRENGVKTAYKSFILNYNIFAVTVSFNGVVYTIESGDCVAILH